MQRRQFVNPEDTGIYEQCTSADSNRVSDCVSSSRPGVGQHWAYLTAQGKEASCSTVQIC